MTGSPDPATTHSRLEVGGGGLRDAQIMDTPPWVSLRKRMTSRALTSRTFLSVWSFFFPL